MDILIWIGAAVSLAGLAGLVWCIARVARAKRNAPDEETLNAEVRAVLPWNMGSLMLSVLGLMIVVLGILLG